MRIVNESLFVSSLRAFFVTFFGMIGLLVGLIAISLIIYGIADLVEEESFSSDVKILTDAYGSRKELSNSVPVLLQINLVGEIGEENLKEEKIEKILLKSREDILKDNRVKGILLHINSPGGGVVDSDVIYRHIEEYKNLYKVPVYAFVDGTCASGGYYIACSADKIYASDVSLIGSIGVLAWPPFFNVSSVLEKIGVNSLTLTAGKGKDEMNPVRPWKPGEQQNYQNIINFYYDRFVNIVLNKRPEIRKETLIDTYGALVFPAPQAKELGLIDGNGYTRSQVIKELAAASGIGKDEKYQVIAFEFKSWVKELIKEKPFFLTGKLKHELVLPQELKNSGTPIQYKYIH